MSTTLVKTVTTPHGNLQVTLDWDPDTCGWGGAITASFLASEEDDEIDMAMNDAIESLVLAHACAGVDVESAAYGAGLGDALETLANRS